MKCRVEFDKRLILVKVQHANLTGLRRSGAYIRKSARNKVSQSTRASSPGSAPNTRRGLLKTALLFGVEKQKQSVVVGPAESIIGTSMYAHEFGGRYKKQRYPKRALMGPTLTATVSKLPKLWEKSVK